MLEVKKLTSDMWKDYIDFFENRAFTDGNINKGCFCVWHHWTEQHEFDRSQLPLNNRQDVKKNFAVKLIQDGRLNGFVAYCADTMVGFCNADKKDNYFRLNRNNSPEIWTEGEDGKKTLSIVCYTVEPDMRGRGIASAMLKVVCEYAAANGYHRIESYPSDGDFLQENCCGNVSMYIKHGFQAYPIGNGIVVRYYC